MFFPYENPKTQEFQKFLLEMQNVMHIATNAGHTTQNDGQTMQNDGRTTSNVGCITFNVSKGPKGGLEEPHRAPGDPPTPLLEKTLVSRNDF